MGAGSGIPQFVRLPKQRFIPRPSAGLSRCGWELGFNAIRRGLPVNEFGDAQQQVAVGLGGDRTAKALIRPVECADAALFVIAERDFSVQALNSRGRSTSRHDLLVDYDEAVGVVVDRCQTGCVAADQGDSDAERSALAGVDVKLVDELA